MKKSWKRLKQSLAFMMGIVMVSTSLQLPVYAAQLDVTQDSLDVQPADDAGGLAQEQQEMVQQLADYNGSQLEGMGSELYRSDFSIADDFDTFQGNNPADWSNETNQLKISGGSGNKAVLKDKEFTDFVYEADVTVEGEADLPDKSSAQAGVLFRVKNPQGNLADGYDGYYFCIDAKNGHALLGKATGTTWTEIAKKKMTVKYNQSYHLTVAVSGNHIVCYVDDNGTNYAKIDVTDSEHTSGSVGFRNWLSKASYENVRVTEYTEPQIDGDIYTNPLLPNCADPDVLYYNGTYYLYPTNAGHDTEGIRVYTSTDLVHWADKGYALKKADVWGETAFWAPDIIEKDGIFYMYYAAQEQICVATSDSPLGPFTQDEKKPMHSDMKEIDAHVFQDDDGQYYIYFVRFTGGNVIYGAKLNDDMMTIDEESIVRVLTADTPWEQDRGNINEGPFMLKKDGTYYLTYSGSHFESPQYGSGYATSDSPLGPFTKYENNPIMQSNSLAHGTGHHGIAQSPDGQELFMVYHRHNSLSQTEPRAFCIDRLQFTQDSDGNTVLEVKGPTVTEQALPSGATNVENLISFALPEGNPIVVPNGTLPEQWGLPKAELITSAGEAGVTRQAEVNWDTSAYQPNSTEKQELTIKGTVILPEGVVNLGNLALEVQTSVTVREAMGNEEVLKEILDKVTIPNKDDIRENIALPTQQDGISLTWTSKNEAVISTQEKENQNYYTTPAGAVNRQAEDTKVTLTVSGEYEGISGRRDIEVTVKALPQKEEYVGYLYTHFNEYPGSIGEQDIFFGISKDGLNWTALNDNKAVLKSEVGDKKVRDPYIIRSAAGDKFYLLATDQNIYNDDFSVDWDKLSTRGSQALTIWESTDLVNWTNHRRVVVADTIEAGAAWAPEAIYDETTGEYLVYWSSKVKSDNFARNYSFVSKTRDFYTFTEPEIFNGLGSNIDTSMYREGDKYYKLVKLEEGDNTHVILQSAQEHPLAYGDAVSEVKIGDRTYQNLGAHYFTIDNSAPNCLESFKGSYEGATMFKFNDREEWCIMVDEFAGNNARGYIPFISKDLDAENSVQALPDNSYIMQEAGKHGGIIPITQREYDALMEKWGTPKQEINQKEKQEPILSYDFEEEKEGDVITDTSGSGLNGKTFGNAVYKYDEEKESSVLYLDGTAGTYAQLPSGLFDGLENLTISMDVKPETTEQNHVDFTIGQDNQRYLFLRFRDNEIRSGITARSWQKERSVIDSESGRLGKWVNVAVVVENHKLSLYIDHQRIAVNEHVRSISELGTNLISYLGKSFYDDPYFKGCYDNVKIYNRALAKDELVQEEKVKLKVKMEAENAILNAPAKVVDRGDASGGKKVGYIDNENATVTFNLDVPEDGTYRIDVVAGSGTDQPNASAKYYVNGNKENAQMIDYVPRGWDVWTAYPIEVFLHEGNNTFTVTHSGRENSFSELDYITFYNYNPKVSSVTLDGKELEGFDTNTYDYSIDVESLDSLPQIEANLTAENENAFQMTVKQPGRENPVGTISITSPFDDSFHAEYTIRFFDKNAFSNPLVNYGADPYVTYQDGYYYYIRVHNDHEIYISRSLELNRIAANEPHMVYTPKEGEPDRELWAPELHFLNGKWYIYYTGGAGANHRMYVLESKTDDPLGEYEFKGELKPTTERWAIDQTVLEYNGSLYAIWSGWDGLTDGEQRLYIAEMSNPYTITGDRVELSKAEYAWETVGMKIHEGPQIAKSPNGVVDVMYSASGSWTDDYCIGRLTLKKDGDPMNPKDWEKGQEPVFTKSAPSTYSTGHACFVKSPDGKEDYIVYHATRGSGQGWNGRGVRTQRVFWKEDGTLDIGKAIGYNTKVNRPSGTPVILRDRYEAEEGVLFGNTAIVETYNSSKGSKVTGFTDDNSSVLFRVNAQKAGTYKLYVRAATGVENAGFAVTVNEKKLADKQVVSFNAKEENGLCTDNWWGYEVEVQLLDGENTIQIGKSAAYAPVDIDYIELELLQETVDKSKLQTLYDGSKNKVQADYETESYQAFKHEMEQTKNVLDNPSASQEEVDKALKALQKAVDNLKPVQKKSNTKELKEMVQKAEALKESDYTKETWKKLKDALTAAKAALSDDTVTQEQVNKKALDLKAAINGLKKQEQPKPEEPSKPQEPANPEPSNPQDNGKWVLDQRGWWYDNGDGTWSANGWKNIDGAWYAFDQNGYMKTGWINDNGTWYYSNGSGVMQTGWVNDGETWYYTSESGAMQTGWINTGGTWYYTNGSGAMQTGWVQDGDTWYYTNGSGAMQTGWVQDAGTWYYTNGSGAMQTGWILDRDTWYYTNESGAMLIGWIQDGDDWYYTNESGAMMTGWTQVGNNWYYMYSNGVMAKSTWIQNYYVNQSGAWSRSR